MSTETKEIPLELRVSRSPQQAGYVVRETLEVIQTVLENLGFKGIWTVSINKQSTKRGNIKFQVVRQEDRFSIRVRTKPGDNGTCWESILIPPSNYDATNVFKDLKMVHPQKLTIALPEVNDEKPSIPSPVTTIFTPPISVDPPLSPAERARQQQAALDEVDAEIQSRLSGISTPQEPKNLLERLPDHVPEPEFGEKDLFLDPDSVTSGLHNSSYVEGRASIVVGDLFKANPIVKRAEATQSLITRLGLHDFVKSHFAFNDPVRCAALILKKLCDEHYLERIPANGHNTKAFKLTDIGKEIYDSNRSLWFTNRELFEPNLQDEEEDEEEDEGVDQEQPLPSLNLSALAPVLAEHDKAQNSVAEYNQWLAQCAIDLEAKNKEVDDLDAKMAPLILRRAEAVKERDDLKKQLAEMEAARKEEEQKVVSLREKLRAAIGG